MRLLIIPLVLWCTLESWAVGLRAISMTSVVILHLQAWAQPQKRRKKGKKGGAEAIYSSSSAHDALQEKLRGSCQSLVTELQV